MPASLTRTDDPPPSPGPVRLTDGTTFYWSRVFPTLWSGLVGIVVVLLWTRGVGDAPVSEALKWGVTVAWAGLSASFFRWLGALKDVWLDGDHLVVGDERRGVRIPLTEVTELEESRFRQVKMITLRLRRPTPLGTRVTFVPRGLKTFLFPYASSPVTGELGGRLPLPPPI